MSRIVEALACFLLLTSGAYAEGVEPDWRIEAVRDITAAYENIHDNHPGPVDGSNPLFRDWLETGRVEALERASRARSEADYWRALSFYVNGFQDGHLAVSRSRAVVPVWPGFLTATDASGTTRVSVSTFDDLPLGTEVTACDGTSVRQLLDDRVHPYRTNAGIPHERLLTASYLFVGAADDRVNLMRSCTVRSGKADRSMALDWKPVDAATLARLLPEAQGRVVPPLGVRQIDGVWFVSLPSFNWWGEKAVEMQAMLDDVKRVASTLHAATRVVIDIRGNAGGNSQWGQQIAAALWGDAVIAAITDSFDETVDWRASAQNAQLTRAAAARSAAAGLSEDAQGRMSIADRMDAAIAKGEAVFSDPQSPSSPGLPADYKSPFAGRVYVLTDMRCASACLNFVDILTRIPDITLIGQPTSADTLYIDNVEKALPSGNAQLSYSLKVYRHRLRGSNQWYVPARTWPGGPMTDAAVARWVGSL